LEERDFAAQTLKFLEHAICRDRHTILIASNRDPLVCLRDGGAPPSDLDRLTRVLQSFRKETVGIRSESTPALRARAAKRSRSSSLAEDAILDECRDAPGLKEIAKDVLRSLPLDGSITAEDALGEFGSAAASYYEALWGTCTADERLALRQLAEEGLVNPQNQAVVRNLMRAGLVVRDPVVRIMNKTFRRFLLQAASADQVRAWERKDVPVPWGSIEAAMITVVVGLAGLLIVTQERVLGAWIGFVPTLMPTAQKLWKVFVAVRPPTKGDVVV
jgi:hypothetical protein